MARRTSLFEDLIKTASKLPWWLALILALLAYLWLHPIAISPIVPSSGLNELGGALTKTLFRSLATFGQYLLPLVFVIGAIISLVTKYRRKTLYDAAGSSGRDAIETMSWQKFEQLVGEAFRQKKYAVQETGGGGADGGIDLVLRKDNETFLVQCKHWKALKVGVGPIRELFGVMADRGAVGGFVVTSGRFTKEATKFAQGRNIELIDGEKLQTLISNTEIKQEIVEDAPEKTEHKVTPVSTTEIECPECGGAMVRRVANKGARAGQGFWGCSQFPKCRGTRPLSAM
ncbi:MAG: restriction endonuclease [Gammaproteobacteria bacterium]|nr:restriction endonuclease [Gammaproteobacteria bacterium]